MEKTKSKTAKNKIFRKSLSALPIVFVGLVVIFIIFAPIHAVHAQAVLNGSPATKNTSSFNLGLGGITDILYTVIGKIFFFIGWVISYIMGIFIAIEAWLVGVVLNLNSGVFDSAIVQTGFSVSLSIANLGFVFGIIIIAIATILQQQTYGVKQILWKLVLMAILVNFGLVIMGVIFSFANQFTTYFLQCIDPSGGGCSGAQRGLTSTNDFASNLAGAFNPQKDFFATNNLNATGTTVAINASSSSVFGEWGSNIGKMLVPIFSVFFIAAALTVIIVTLGTFIFMLLARYVYIAILAVLLPFAWMLWVFPATKSYFDKWWSEFIRWTLFAPIVLFFMWLALTTAHGLSSNATGTQSFTQIATSNSNVVWGAISNFFTGILSPVIQNILNEIVLVGLMVGGMIAANSLGITGANTAIGAMKSVGKAVGNYSLKQGKKGVRAAYQGGVKIPFTNRRILQGEKITRALQTSRIPGVSMLGRGLSSISTNQKMVEEAKRKVPENPEEIRKNLRGSMGKEEQFAHIAKLVEKGEFREKDENGNDEMINGQTVRAFLDKNLDVNSDVAKRYGQVLLGMNANKLVGSDKSMRDAEGELNTTKELGNAIDVATAVEKLDKATASFVSKLQKADMSKMNVNNIFGQSTELSRALARGFLNAAPHLTSSLLPSMKSRALNKFADIYLKEITDKRQKINDTMTGKDKDDALEELKKKENSFNQSLLNNVLFSSMGNPTASPNPPPPPPPPPGAK